MSNGGASAGGEFERGGGASGGKPGKRRASYPGAVDRLIAELARLPGVGRKSAERLAFFLLKSRDEDALALAEAITAVKKSVRHCTICSNLSDGPTCLVCGDPERDRRTVLVVEQPKDLIALEDTGMYRGLYHVLLGRLSPLDGVGPEELTISDLIRRVDDPGKNPGGVRVEEVILGLNPTVEGDGTALYLMEQIKSRGMRVTRLARGLPSGSQLEYVNKAVLADAIEGRRSME
ncbi:MAG: recombination mediator RecR [Planctomycetota bacterium]|nr:recombination mediator RecR [Planctomycetota bacterium]